MVCEIKARHYIVRARLVFGGIEMESAIIVISDVLGEGRGFYYWVVQDPRTSSPLEYVRY